MIGVTGRLLGTIYPDAGLIESGCAVVLVDVDPASAGRPATPETMESIGQPRWLDRAAARAAIASGEIRCGVTLAALTLWWATTDQG